MPFHIWSDEELAVLARIEQKVERIEKQAQSMTNESRVEFEQLVKQVRP